ncbi:MAG: YqaA family protein [Desulfovibrionaceae bacterium]
MNRFPSLQKIKRVVSSWNVTVILYEVFVSLMSKIKSIQEKYIKKCENLARTRYAEYFLWLISCIESVFFPIPPDTILLPMCLLDKKKAYRYAFGCTIASVLGGIIGYYIGLFFMDTLGLQLVETYRLQDIHEKATIWFEQYGVLTLLVAGLTPLPYKLATITTGALGFGIVPFIITSFFGRGIRFFIIAFLARMVNEKMRVFAQKHLGILLLLFTLLLFGGFIALLYL